MASSEQVPSVGLTVSSPPSSASSTAGDQKKLSRPKLEVSRSSTNFDANITSPLTSVVEHSFLPNPTLFEQAAQEFEAKQKRRISGAKGGDFTPSLPPTPISALSFTSFDSQPTKTSQDLKKAVDEMSIDELHQLLDELKEKEACFAEEFVNEEIVDVCKDLFKVLEMRKKHRVGEYNIDDDEAYHQTQPWNCFFKKEDFVGSVDEDFLLAHARGVQNRIDSSEARTSYDPHDLEACKSLPVTMEDDFEMHKGLFRVKTASSSESYEPPVSFEEHYEDYRFLSRIMYEAATKSYCYTRLQALELKFTLYKKLKQFEEVKTQKMVPHRDWYNVRKVDGHLHLSSMANQKHLLRYIKRKLKQCPDEKVIVRDGKVLTLAEVFQSLNMTPYDLSVDTLDCHVDKSQTMHRFDKFNLKYSPFGQSRLREIFLKTENMVEGKYFAEMSKELFKDLEDSRYNHAEPRVSIYGKEYNEWQSLSHWVCQHKMYSDNVRWVIQIPRLYDIHKKFKAINTFQDMLDNIFRPLFEATRNPGQYPEISTFLNFVVGFDSVDDESKPEPRFHNELPTPEEWTEGDNPPYAYYTYYFYANIKILNAYRKSKGLNTFSFRPHAGEAGSASHLVSAYLTSDAINHGIELRKAPVLAYLYYLSQIGLAMSPLSNNSLFLSYEKNPFPQFFERGLNVTLSTDDPLMFHFTREPLMEEYSIAAQVYHLSNVDLCEIARNSVLQSGWEEGFKRYWLGTSLLFGSNDIRQSNVPNMRLKYRFETLFDEHLFIQKSLAIGYLTNKLKSLKDSKHTATTTTTCMESLSGMAPQEVFSFMNRERPVHLNLGTMNEPREKFYGMPQLTHQDHQQQPFKKSAKAKITSKESRQADKNYSTLVFALSAVVLLGTVVLGNMNKH